MIAHAQLPTFMAVAELLNLSAAAKKLGITQTGATQRIKSLEQSLGTTLFTRSRSGMRLTEEGRLLLRYCTEVSNLEGQFFSGIKGAGHTREVELCIVGPMSLLAGRVVPRYSEIAHKWPNVNLRFVIDSNANRLNQLKRGACDLAFVFPHEVGLELDSKLIKPVEYVLVAAVTMEEPAIEADTGNGKAAGVSPWRHDRPRLPENVSNCWSTSRDRGSVSTRTLRSSGCSNSASALECSRKKSPNR